MPKRKLQRSQVQQNRSNLLHNHRFLSNKLLLHHRNNQSQHLNLQKRRIRKNQKLNLYSPSPRRKMTKRSLNLSNKLRKSHLLKLIRPTLRKPKTLRQHPHQCWQVTLRAMIACFRPFLEQSRSQGSRIQRLL